MVVEGRKKKGGRGGRPCCKLRENTGACDPEKLDIHLWKVRGDLSEHPRKKDTVNLYIESRVASPSVCVRSGISERNETPRTEIKYNVYLAYLYSNRRHTSNQSA